MVKFVTRHDLLVDTDHSGLVDYSGPPRQNVQRFKVCTTMFGEALELSPWRHFLRDLDHRR